MDSVRNREKAAMMQRVRNLGDMQLEFVNDEFRIVTGTTLQLYFVLATSAYETI